MLRNLILEVGWFVDFAPSWLGPALIGTGVVALVLGINFRYEIVALDTAIQPGFGVALIFITSIFVLYPWFVEFRDLFALSIILFARALEGAATVRFTQKVLYVIENRELPSTGGVKTKIKFYLAGPLIVIIGVWAMIGVVIFAPISSSFIYSIALIWTLVTLLLATLGIVWKVHQVDERPPPLFTLGIILAFSGIEIYNYTSLINDIWAFIFANVAYTAGYVIAIIIWMRARSENVDTSTMGGIRG